MRRWMLGLGCLLLVAGCGGGGEEQGEAAGPVTMNAAAQEAWEIALVEARIEKNEDLMGDPNSPLPPDQRDGFEGLDYYFPVPELRFRPVVAVAEGDTIVLEKRRGDKVRYLRHGHVRIQHGGQAHALAVFRPLHGGDGTLWLPFYDGTNGESTYPGGRYLDLEVAPDGTVDLDFNRAYNPLCAYDAERYNCTLPPEENRLPFAVTAGEKLFAGVH